MEENRELYYTIDGLVNEDETKYKNRAALKEDPPLLIFSDGEEETVLVLTKETALSLSEDLEEVNRAYSGMRRLRKDRNPYTFIKDFPQYFSEYPMKSILILLPIAVILFLMIKSFF